MGKQEKLFEIAVGQKIKFLREEKNWSQEDLAHLAGIGKTQISRIETGKHSPKLETIVAISKALHKYPHELLDVSLALDFNLGFNPEGKRRPKTKELLFELADTDFFHIPRSVDAVAHQCKKVFNIDLLKPAISAILKDMVERRKLFRSKDDHSRKFLYKKRGK